MLLDHHGEGLGSNAFVVREGEILTPYERFVLPGVRRATVIELAVRPLGISYREADIDLCDAPASLQAARGVTSRSSLLPIEARVASRS